MSEHEQRVAVVDQVTPSVFDWGAIHWLVSGQQFAGSQMTFGHVEIKPGHKNAKHYHPNCDEVLYLLEGELDHSVGDDVFHLTPGMAIHIPTGVGHDAINRGRTVARMVVAYSSGDRQTRMLEAGQEQ